MTKRKLRVGVLFGGRSGEHEVSLNSARNVMEALARAGHDVVPIGITPAGRWLTDNDPLALLNGASAATQPPAAASLAVADEPWALLPRSRAQAEVPAIDVIFPVLHGTYGEDGTVQGLLEMANLPYVGCGVLASAAAMDKVMAKQLFAQAGLRQAAYGVVLRPRFIREPEQVMAELEDGLGYPLFVKPANLGQQRGHQQGPRSRGTGRRIGVGRALRPQAGGRSRRAPRRGRSK